MKDKSVLLLWHLTFFMLWLSDADCRGDMAAGLPESGRLERLCLLLLACASAAYTGVQPINVELGLLWGHSEIGDLDGDSFADGR